VKGDLGKKSECVAEEFLRRLGYRVVSRNYQCPLGELDLVAVHKRVIVFIEVRSRSGSQFGSPLETVGFRKQQQVARVALHFLSQKRLHGRDARFDVVGVTWDRGSPHIEHVQHAFDLLSRDRPK
jgi:putative endonuclease